MEIINHENLVKSLTNYKLKLYIYIYTHTTETKGKGYIEEGEGWRLPQDRDGDGYF